MTPLYKHTLTWLDGHVSEHETEKELKDLIGEMSIGAGYHIGDCLSGTETVILNAPQPEEVAAAPLSASEAASRAVALAEQLQLNAQEAQERADELTAKAVEAAEAARNAAQRLADETAAAEKAAKERAEAEKAAAETPSGTENQPEGAGTGDSAPGGTSEGDTKPGTDPE